MIKIQFLRDLAGGPPPNPFKIQFLRDLGEVLLLKVFSEHLLLAVFSEEAVDLELNLVSHSPSLLEDNLRYRRNQIKKSWMSSIGKTN